MLTNNPAKYAKGSYPGFEYPITQLKKFVEAAGFFTIMLDSGAVVYYAPDQPKDFRLWLEANNITDVRTNWASYLDLK